MKEEIVDQKRASLADRLRLASRERRDLQKQELRRQILCAAAELFVEQGYDHFSLRQVAERIGYSATTIYLYFQNKDDLLFEVVYDGWRRFSEEFVVAAAQGGDPVERLRSMGRCYIRFGLDNPAVYDLMFVQRTDFLVHENLHSEGKPLDLFEVLCAGVRDAIDAGLFRPGDVVTYSDAIWAAAHGIVSLCPNMIDDERRERAIEVVLSMCLDGLRAC
ncbi:MAG TPA: TetR/AcrR family transcriptional regulator [Chloroflexota bacterium]